MRTVGVVTAARSDYGIYRPVLKKIREMKDLELRLFVTGMHLAPEFGMTVKEIEEDGFPVGERIQMLLSSDTPEAISKSMGLGTIGFAQAYSRSRPDILLALGDRFEMLSAVTAALPFAIPVAHIHGGEATEGLIDEAIRHSITKMSHLHFVATEQYGRRVVQMGEEPWRVTVSGAPGLDNLHVVDLMSREQLEKTLNIPLDPPPLLVTFHPVTLEYEDTQWHIEELLLALEKQDHPIVFTYPNSDTFGRMIIESIKGFTRRNESTVSFENLGTEIYFSLMKYCSAMVGNSSSGIIEAASFELPVVDIGIRQQGRIRGDNVIHSQHDHPSIAQAIGKATTPEFRKHLSGIKNPYGEGQASGVIADVLRTVKIDRTLTTKRFHSLRVEED